MDHKHNIPEIPEKIKKHIEMMVQKNGKNISSSEISAMSEAWLDKMLLFDHKSKEMNLKDSVEWNPDSSKPAIAMTYSGSLLTLFPEKNEAEYISIGLRTHVPDYLKLSLNHLETVKIGENAVFNDEKLKHTSAIYKITVCPDSMPPALREETVYDAAEFFENEFTEINRSLLDIKPADENISESKKDQTPVLTD